MNPQAGGRAEPGKWIDALSSVGVWIAGSLMLLVALSMFYEAVARRFFDSPTTWVMAFSILAFMWFTFLSTPHGIKADKHICCDVFVSRLADGTRQWLGIWTDATTLIYIIALGYFGYTAFYEAYEFQSTNEGLVRYPLWILRISMPLGMALSLLQTLRKIHLRWVAFRTLDHKSGPGNWGGPVFVTVCYLVTLSAGILSFTISQPVGILLTALVVLFWGLPISFGLAFVGLTGLLFFHGGVSGLNTLPLVAENTTTNFILLAIPLFTLGGLILSKSGLGEEMYDFSSKWLGWLPGGLGVATCITGGILAAMIGSSTAVTAIVTLVAMKPLLDRGYDKKLVVGTVTGSSLGLIIPPSIGFIVYGYLTDTSVGTLFMAGFVPGIMLVVMFSLYVIINCRVSGKYQTVSYTWQERFSSLGRSVVIMLGPIFVLGSIYTGLATPTEAGAVLVIYSLFCAVIYRKIDWKGFLHCLTESSALSTMILMIMVGALTMSNVITLLQVPMNLTEAIVSSGLPVIVVIGILILFYLVLGMFLDGGSITVLTVPVIAPMLPALGIDTVVFGVILMMLIETALLTPPVGLNIFTVKGIVDEPLSFIIKSVFPFVLILIVGVLLMFLFPGIALWLPSKM